MYSYLDGIIVIITIRGCAKLAHPLAVCILVFTYDNLLRFCWYVQH